MSLDQLSIGNELKDSYKITDKWVQNGINWLGDIDEFYKERAQIEKEYALKLSDLCKRHFKKKAENSSHLSVGDEPQITPGSLESASVVLWTEVLTLTEKVAKERDNFATELTTKILRNLESLQAKSNKIARHVSTINEFLTNEKKETEDEVTKAKKAYDALCQNTENARQKTEKSSSEKYKQKFQDKEVEMNNGKNNYLIHIAVANRLKDKYYFQDLPELLDYYQDLNELRVAILNKLLKNALIIERNSNDKVKEYLHEIDATVEQNNPKLDTAMFIKHNAVAWKEPQDFYFVPCDFWHDDETLVTKEPELTSLKKRLNSSLTAYSSAKEKTLLAKQKLEEIAQARSSSEDRGTLKFDSMFDDVLTLLQRFMKDDSARLRTEVAIEIIQNYAGDQDLSYVEVKKEKKRGLGGLFRLSTSLGQAAAPTATDAQSIHTVNSTITAHSGGLGGIFSLRRKNTTASITPGARALYAYEAAGDDEVSISAGELVEVVEEDDGSGWTLVKSLSGTGLVPTTYIEINKVEENGKKKGPTVAPKRGAKRVQYVEALYDYTAEEDNELTIHAGERIVLVQDDTDNTGWTEGELNGARGLFPSLYVKKI